MSRKRSLTRGTPCLGMPATCEMTDTTSPVRTSNRRSISARTDAGRAADHLVRRRRLPHVARRHVEGRLDRLVEDAHGVVTLQPGPRL